MLSPPPLSREKPWGSIPLSDLSWSPAGPWGSLAPWPLHPRLWKSVFLPRRPSLVLPLRATSACLLLKGRASQESLPPNTPTHSRRAGRPPGAPGGGLPGAVQVLSGSRGYLLFMKVHPWRPKIPLDVRQVT